MVNWSAVHKDKCSVWIAGACCSVVHVRLWEKAFNWYLLSKKDKILSTEIARMQNDKIMYYIKQHAFTIPTPQFTHFNRWVTGNMFDEQTIRADLPCRYHVMVPGCLKKCITNTASVVTGLCNKHKHLHQAKRWKSLQITQSCPYAVNFGPHFYELTSSNRQRARGTFYELEVLH